MGVAIGTGVADCCSVTGAVVTTVESFWVGSSDEEHFVNKRIIMIIAAIIIVIMYFLFGLAVFESIEYRRFLIECFLCRYLLFAQLSLTVYCKQCSKQYHQ